MPIPPAIRRVLDYIYDKEGREYEDEHSHPPTDQPTKFGIDIATFRDNDNARKYLCIEPTVENLKNLTQARADQFYMKVGLMDKK